MNTVLCECWSSRHDASKLPQSPFHVSVFHVAFSSLSLDFVQEIGPFAGKAKQVSKRAW